MQLSPTRGPAPTVTHDRTGTLCASLTLAAVAALAACALSGRMGFSLAVAAALGFCVAVTEAQQIEVLSRLQMSMSEPLIVLAAVLGGPLTAALCGAARHDRLREVAGAAVADLHEPERPEGRRRRHARRGDGRRLARGRPDAHGARRPARDGRGRRSQPARQRRRRARAPRRADPHAPRDGRPARRRHLRLRRARRDRARLRLGARRRPGAVPRDRAAARREQRRAHVPREGAPRTRAQRGHDALRARPRPCP